MMHVSPLFQIPPIFKKCSDSVENFLNLTFSRKISRFSSAKISDDLFLVLNHKFRIPPIFPVSVHFSPVSRRLLFPPALKIFHLVLEKNHLHAFYILYVYFVSPPYFDHDAFIHPPNARTGRLW